MKAESTTVAPGARADTPSKDELRKAMRERRKAIDPGERERASQAVCRQLSEIVRQSPLSPGAVAVYLASSAEIDLSRFIREMLACGREVVAPRWNGDSYELSRLQGLSEDALRRGPMNIAEPAGGGSPIAPETVSIWVIPALALARDGRRLGYGGGWYDRLLASSAASAVKIGVGYDFQLVDDIPTEPHDIRLDRITVAGCQLPVAGCCRAGR